MQILEGSSDKNNAHDAVCEAIEPWADDVSPDILFVFHSSQQNPHIVSATLTQRFPDSLIVGCTTAGEWLSGQHKNNALVLSALSTSDIRWSISLIEDLNKEASESAKKVCAELLQQLDLNKDELKPDKHFCLSFFDGLSAREEPIIAAMANELGHIPLLGGSAADDLKFEHTYIIANGKAYQHAALFILAESNAPFHAIKHQHYIATDIILPPKLDIKAEMV